MTGKADPATSQRFSICVYCGARGGNDPAHVSAARQVGTEIGQRGWQLVYGGGKAGLMGELADAVLAAGGHVVGVIPERLMAWEVAHRQITELCVVQTMHERKQQMAAHANAFLALPGGLGTLEELFEVWTWRHLGYHRQPIGLLDTCGYYQPLMEMVHHMVHAGFVDAGQQAMLTVDNDIPRLLDTLAKESALTGAASASYVGL